MPVGFAIRVLLVPYEWIRTPVLKINRGGEGRQLGVPRLSVVARQERFSEAPFAHGLRRQPGTLHRAPVGQVWLLITWVLAE